MGIIDFVKSGVQRMMIARRDADKDKIVFKHPDQTFPFWSQLTVDSDEVCLFFRDGQFVGAIGPGRHTLHTQNVPFLNALIDQFTRGNLFTAELFFVTMRPQYNQAFGDVIGSMRDPELDIRVTPRAHGTFSFRVIEPVQFVLEFLGQSGESDTGDAMRWVRDQLFSGLRATLTRLVKEGDLTLMDLGAAGPEVARAIVADCPDISRLGVQVLEIAKLNINLSEEDQARIDRMQDQIVQAKVDARAARLRLAEAQAEAEQRQIALDQDFYNRARYVQDLDMARYQQYAGAEAMLGAGAGMSRGEGASAAGASSGFAVGVGLAAGFASAPGFHNAAAARSGPGGAPHSAEPEKLGGPRCLRCNAVSLPGSKFCSQCGTAFG
ncbi:MAG TPA: SPFH domain-containing protein [Polyangiaceae bacterium]